jgi:hypothetical protein
MLPQLLADYLFRTTGEVPGRRLRSAGWAAQATERLGSLVASGISRDRSVTGIGADQVEQPLSVGKSISDLRFAALTDVGTPAAMTRSLTATAIAAPTVCPIAATAEAQAAQADALHRVLDEAFPAPITHGAVDSARHGAWGPPDLQRSTSAASSGVTTSPTPSGSGASGATGTLNEEVLAPSSEEQPDMVAGVAHGIAAATTSTRVLLPTSNQQPSLTTAQLLASQHAATGPVPAVVSTLSQSPVTAADGRGIATTSHRRAYTASSALSTLMLGPPKHTRTSTPSQPLTLAGLLGPQATQSARHLPTSTTQPASGIPYSASFSSGFPIDTVPVSPLSQAHSSILGRRRGSAPAATPSHAASSANTMQVHMDSIQTPVLATPASAAVRAPVTPLLVGVTSAAPALPTRHPPATMYADSTVPLSLDAAGIVEPPLPAAAASASTSHKSSQSRDSIASDAVIAAAAGVDEDAGEAAEAATTASQGDVKQPGPTPAGPAQPPRRPPRPVEEKQSPSTKAQRALQGAAGSAPIMRHSQ